MNEFESSSFELEKRTLLSKLDFNFVLIILALNLVGLINLYSATHGVHSQEINSLFIQQIVWLVLGWGIFFLFTFLDYQFLSRASIPIYIINFCFLILTAFFGKVSLGAQRWIDLGFFRYQPSESMKLAMILVLARLLYRKSVEGSGMGIRDLLIPGLFILVPLIFVMEQPDLGTAMMLAATSGSMLLFIKIRRSILLSLIVSAAVAIPIGWNFLQGYQKARILTFMAPDIDPKGTGYNSIQSKIAVGSGRIVGKGFRKGTQSQLEFLPERHTDFIFSVLAEEHGFIGCLTVISLFLILFVVGVRIASQSKDKLGALLCVGILSYLFWHMFVNIGMVIGLLPIVGIPLPLLSYGGSSMLTTMAGLGIISAVSYRRYLF